MRDLFEASTFGLSIPPDWCCEEAATDEDRACLSPPGNRGERICFQPPDVQMYAEKIPRGLQTVIERQMFRQ